MHFEFTENLQGGLDAVSSVNDLRLVEARAAVLYWSHCKLTLTHYKKIPKYWLEFYQGTSSISGGNRHATRPINAMLNYGYSVLAGQAKRTARKKLQTYGGKF